MIVIQDTREQRPLPNTRFPVEIATLPAGDYGIRGFSDLQNPQFAVERKSIDDLAGSLTGGRKRFFREIEQLRRFRFAAILIECERADVEAKAYRCAANPVSILASLDAIQVRTGVHVLWATDREGAARRLEDLVRQFARGIVKDYKRLRETAEAAQ